MPSVTRRQFVLGATVGSTVGQQHSLGLSSDGDTINSWSFEDDIEFTTVPSVGSDLVYVASRQGYNYRSELYALDADTGSERWRFSPEQYIRTPATEGSELVYVGGLSGLFALDTERGEEQWHFEIGRVRSGPTVANGVVFAGTDDGKLYALDAESGDEQWNFEVGSEIYTQVVSNGRLYVAGKNDVYSLDAETGDQRWHNGDVGTEVPLTVHENWIYVQQDDESIIALDDSGDEQWQFAPPEQLSTDAPAILGGVAYIGTAEVVDNFVYGVDAQTGDEVWRYTSPEGIELYVAVASDSLFVAGENVHAVNPTNRQERWVFHPEYSAEAPPAIGTGQVYVQTGRRGESRLHARSIEDGGSGIGRQLRRGAESAVLGILGIAPALLLALLAWNRYRRNQNSKSEMDEWR
jgi:outer membrane protein assembly factor BamB